MSTNGLFANPAEIAIDGQKMVEFAGDLAVELDDFDKNVNELMEIWHGDSAQAFLGVYLEEKAQLRNFQQMLNDKGEALKNAASTLSDAEAQNASGAGRLVS